MRPRRGQDLGDDGDDRRPPTLEPTRCAPPWGDRLDRHAGRHEIPTHDYEPDGDSKEGGAASPAAKTLIPGPCRYLARLAFSFLVKQPREAYNPPQTARRVKATRPTREREKTAAEEGVCLLYFTQAHAGAAPVAGSQRERQETPQVVCNQRRPAAGRT